MKTAKKYPSGYYVDCPSCGEGIPDPDSGALTHDAGAAHLTSGAILTCDACGEKCKAPKVIQK